MEKLGINMYGTA